MLFRVLSAPKLPTYPPTYLPTYAYLIFCYVNCFSLNVKFTFLYCHYILHVHILRTQYSLLRPLHLLIFNPTVIASINLFASVKSMAQIAEYVVT